MFSLQEVCEYLLNEVVILALAMYDMHYVKASVVGRWSGRGGGGWGGGCGGAVWRTILF